MYQLLIDQNLLFNQNYLMRGKGFFRVEISTTETALLDDPFHLVIGWYAELLMG